MQNMGVTKGETLELIHCQNKIPKGGKPKPWGANAPLKETLLPNR